MNGAVIIETRVLPDLAKIINDHLKYIPEDWGLTVFCSKENVTLLGNLSRDATIFYLDAHFPTSEYNKLLKSVEFWDKLKYEHVLIFQTDSMLLREGIEEFLEWDYVGAPWKLQYHGGNGGLSLRKVAVMKEICEKATFSKRNEDTLICNYMKEHEYNLAPREVCEKFSVEAIFKLGTLGYHSPEKWLTDDECEQIITQYEKENRGNNRDFYRKD